MAFKNWHDFLSMGHHGFYVWSAYGIFLIIALWNIVLPRRQYRLWLQEQAQRHRRTQGGL